MELAIQEPRRLRQVDRSAFGNHAVVFSVFECILQLLGLAARFALLELARRGSTPLWNLHCAWFRGRLSFIVLKTKRHADASRGLISSQMSSRLAFRSYGITTNRTLVQKLALQPFGKSRRDSVQIQRYFTRWSAFPTLLSAYPAFLLAIASIAHSRVAENRIFAVGSVLL